MTLKNRTESKLMRKLQFECTLYAECSRNSLQKKRTAGSDPLDPKTISKTRRIIEFRSLEPKEIWRSSGPSLGFTYIF